MILSAIERPDSPFVRIQYVDAAGKIRRVKTTIRKNDPDKALRVAKALNDTEAQLLNSTARATGGGWHWVPSWLKAKYGQRKLTLRTYEAQWKWLSLFLRVNGLSEPGMLTREHCFAYAEWRIGAVKEKSGKSPSINTACNELKLLGQIMDEASERGLAGDKNPARKLGIERAETAIKPEITDPELKAIFRALKSKSIWMQRSFFLALNTGLRFATTRLDRKDVNQARNQIVIERPKGGNKRAFAIPIYPEIAAVITRWMSTRDRFFWDLPPEKMDFASLEWTRFFREIRMSHLCFHCTRVTFITRGAQAGIPEAMMMKMVNHASIEIHRIYQRLADGNAVRYRSQIAIPSFDASIS